MPWCSRASAGGSIRCSREPNLRYVLLPGAEEACEMTGVTIVLIGLLRYVEHHIGVMDVRIVDDLPRR